MSETAQQQAKVDALVRKGWRVDVDGAGATGTVYMSRRDRKVRSLTHYVEVEPDGTINGDTEEASKR
jgi:hypothetical protein